jgi:hypothetical protein
VLRRVSSKYFLTDRIKNCILSARLWWEEVIQTFIKIRRTYGRAICRWILQCFAPIKDSQRDKGRCEWPWSPVIIQELPHPCWHVQAKDRLHVTLRYTYAGSSRAVVYKLTRKIDGLTFAIMNKRVYYAQFRVLILGRLQKEQQTYMLMWYTLCRPFVA